MNKLIEALEIFLKYKDLEYPTDCKNDVLYIVGITNLEITIDDRNKLGELGFMWDGNHWMSYKYGSA